jgi:sulfide:quinone oxidoreductase
MADGERSERLRVVIAGGGVAGLEALLALRSLAGERVEIVLLTPGSEFEFRPLLVAEPFGLELTVRLDLAPILAEAGAQHRRAALASIDPKSQVAMTSDGAELEYDALLVAPGARPVDSVPGALSFAGSTERARFRELLSGLGRRGSRRLAFVIPRGSTWTIAAYELALLTAAERDGRRLDGVELVLITSEKEPLELVGRSASELVTGKLAEAGIEVRAGSAASRFEDKRVELDDGESIAADHAVALPGLQVPDLPGLPQRAAGGFVGTDASMHVEGLQNVWAAGDVTTFAIKQGGLAAQQADVAARAIAARAGAHVPIQAFKPVLRAALITGRALEFMRSGGSRGEAVGARALWWPPTKIAGAYLGPLLARAAGEDAGEEMVDLDPSEQPEADEAEREAAIRLVLAAAEADAKESDFEGALRWLGLVEQLNLVLPPEYAAKRYEWRRQLDPGLAPDAVAARVEPRFRSAEAGLSDLQRRIGWLREIERRNESEMEDHLAHLDAGMNHLHSLTRQTGADRIR